MDSRTRPFRIRAWRPTDRPHQDMFLRHLTREDIRMRFGMTRIFAEDLFPDFTATRQGTAFAAWDESNAILGVANLMRLDDTSAELAVIVRSDHKRHGLGRALIGHSLRGAALRGLACVVGYVLTENTPMLTLARAMNFRCVHRTGSMVEVSRPVGFA